MAWTENYIQPTIKKNHARELPDSSRNAALKMHLYSGLLRRISRVNASICPCTISRNGGSATANRRMLFCISIRTQMVLGICGSLRTTAVYVDGTLQQTAVHNYQTIACQVCTMHLMC